MLFLTRIMCIFGHKIFVIKIVIASQAIEFFSNILLLMKRLILSQGESNRDYKNVEQASLHIRHSCVN